MSRDLFGEIPVLEFEVDAWCVAVAGLAPDSPRRPHYITAWGVHDKIREAKENGTLEAVLAGSHPTQSGR